jgi:hypothetical protein
MAWNWDPTLAGKAKCQSPKAAQQSQLCTHRRYVFAVNNVRIDYLVDTKLLSGKQTHLIPMHIQSNSRKFTLLQFIDESL